MVVEAVAVISGGFAATADSGVAEPVAHRGRARAVDRAWAWWARRALIAVLTRAALKGERASAVQSATGFYYLAVVTAFTAEVAVKTRFLG